MRGSAARESSPDAAFMRSVRFSSTSQAIEGRTPATIRILTRPSASPFSTRRGGLRYSFDASRDVLRLDGDEVPDAVLSLENYGKTGDYVTQETLCPETDDCGDDGRPCRSRQRIAKEDAKDQEHHDDKDDITECVAHQRDRGVLPLDARHGLPVQ